MKIYELITPSDPIVFRAENDKIAYVCAILLSSGKAGVNDEDGKSIPCMFFFASEEVFERDSKEYLGMTLGDFLESNRPQIAECFKSFSYGTVEDRKSYDDALEAITDPDKLKQFKEKHEDRNRTSMSQWVKSAWKMGDNINLKGVKSNG